MKALEEQVEPRYISTTDTAKIVRATLKREFPRVKFSVRSDKYAGGSSIHVTWTDGPTDEQVEEITGPFNGKGFDGMIDLAYYKTSWLLPDGTARFAHTGGTASSKGSVPEAFGSPMDPGAELVHFGADYVMTARQISPAFRARIVAKVTEALGEEPNASKQYDSWKDVPCMRHIQSNWGDSIVQQVISRTATAPSDWVPEYRRPKPKKASKPRPTLLRMSAKGGITGIYGLEGEWYCGQCFTVRHAHGFHFNPETAQVHYWDEGKTPKYVRAAILAGLSWAAGKQVSEFWR